MRTVSRIGTNIFIFGTLFITKSTTTARKATTATATTAAITITSTTIAHYILNNELRTITVSIIHSIDLLLYR